MEKIAFVASQVDGAPVTKLGGQPTWLAAPSWPLSRETGQPMAFVGQFRLPGRLAYLFMTSEEDFVDGTYEPEGGENAFFCQPGPLPSFVRFAPLAVGPTHSSLEHTISTGGAAEDPDDVWSRVGGEPNWLQGPEVPSAAPEFVAQLDSCGVPFEINFGDAGVGYAFVSPSGEGRFLWQCG